MRSTDLSSQQLSMLAATEEDFKHSATRLVEEGSGCNVHSHKFVFNQGNMYTVFCPDMTGHTFFAVQVEVAVAVESGK